MKLTEHYRATEDMLNANVDYKDMVLQIAEKLQPFIKADIEACDMEKVLEKFAPLAFMKMAEIMISGKNEKNQLSAATALVDRAGYRPIERSINLEGDLSKLGDKQLDSFLKNAWNRLPAQEKNKLLNLVKDEEGNYSVPQGDQIPNVSPNEIEEIEFD